MPQSSRFVFTQPGPGRLLSTKELLELPPPSWLISPILPLGGLVGLYGPSGNGKTFVALDMALSVATGASWQGRSVERGFVVYVSAEGGSGIGKRVKAWLQAHSLDASQADIAWIIESIAVDGESEDIDALIDRIDLEVERQPSMIVLDTMARVFVGDENETADMGSFVKGVDKLREAFGCTVMVVHHTPRADSYRERGNGAFRGATDTMIRVLKEDVSITVSCDKQKDAEEFEEIALELTKVEGTDSCIVVGGVSKREVQEKESSQVLELLKEIGPSTWDAWRANTGLDSIEFSRHFDYLRRSGKIEHAEGKSWKAKVR